MTKRKKKGLAKLHLRKLRDPAGVVHLVRTRSKEYPVHFRFVYAHMHTPTPLLLITKRFPHGSTNGTWVDEDVATTCIGCVVF